MVGCIPFLCRKDSFVTHRAFCDALIEENNKINHSLVKTPASGPPILLQTQARARDLFPSSVAISTDSCMEIPAVLKQNSSLMDPPIFNFTNSPLPNGSAAAPPTPTLYTSATALLQKAAEMGTKISDNSISPILLFRGGFTGYSGGGLINLINSNSNSNSNSVQELASTAAAAAPAGLSGTVGLYESSSASPNFVHYYSSGAGGNNYLVERSGLNFMGAVGRRDQKKMTVDFLGVEDESSSFSNKKRRFEGDVDHDGDDQYITERKNQLQW